MIDLTKAQLVRSLNSTTCPACGGAKQRAHTFCGRCYWRLPVGQRKRLYDGLGHGYEEAVRFALHSLGATTFINPPREQDA